MGRHLVAFAKVLAPRLAAEDPTTRVAWSARAWRAVTIAVRQRTPRGQPAPSPVCGRRRGVV